MALVFLICLSSFNSEKQRLHPSLEGRGNVNFVSSGNGCIDEDLLQMGYPLVEYR